MNRGETVRLRRSDHPDLAVQACVKPVDVLGDDDLKVVDRLPRALVADQLAFEQRFGCLGGSVAVGIAATAKRGDRAGIGTTEAAPGRYPPALLSGRGRRPHFLTISMDPIRSAKSASVWASISSKTSVRSLRIVAAARWTTVPRL